MTDTQSESIDIWQPSRRVFGLFVFVVILPLVDGGRFLPDWLIAPHLGVIHLPSLLFIGLSLLVYWREAEKEAKKSRPATIDAAGVSEARTRLSHVLHRGDGETGSATPDLMLERFLQLSEDKSPLVRVIDQAVRLGHGGEALASAVASKLRDLTHFHHLQSRYWTQVASTLPLLGMTGTIAGLLFMFSSGDAGGDRAGQLAGLGIALLTTLYASLLTVLVVKPLANSHGQQVDIITHLGEDIADQGQRLAAYLSPRQIKEAEDKRIEVPLHGRR